MADNIFDKARITDEEWEKLKIGRLNPRPNAKSSYGAASFNTERTKSLFDAQGKLFKEKHNELVDYARKEEDTRSESESERKTAESERIESELSRVSSENERINAELERKSAEEQRELTFIREQEQRNDLFENAEAQRQSDYEAAEEERDRLFNIGEGIRFEAEGERSRAEESRVSAEEGRDAAEKLREEAAAAREESFSYLPDPYKIPIRDVNGNIPVTVDEEVIANRERVAVDGYSVYMYVNNLLNLLVDGAPDTMNTFREIADLLGSGDDAATILGKIAHHTNEISGINEALAKHEGEIADLEARIDEGITLTEADKAEIVQSVLNALPSAEGVMF